ncbi:MAG: methyltransferase domain-containing protein [Nitrospiraceae bacterium]|jgi:predicted SAM-dependent methyltransferase|nr:MAG: methyltransferase domain-containing protein [Nitrospiraceae bacterium]
MNRSAYFDDIKYPRTFFRLRRSVNADIERLLAELRKHVNKGLHLGSGFTKLEGLINCDLFNPEADLKADAKDLSMFADGSIDYIESHHMIEHLSFADTESALREWHRVLRPGGLIVISCPDIFRIFLKWLKYSAIYPLFPRQEKLDFMIKMIVGPQQHEGQFHRNAFDSRRMSQLLSRHGFSVEFSFSPYSERPTPSLLVIARKNSPSQ